MPRNATVLRVEHARIALAAAVEPLRALGRYELPEPGDYTAQAHAVRFEALTDLYRIGAGYEDISALDASELRLLPRVPNLRVATDREALQAMADAAVDAGLVPAPSPEEDGTLGGQKS